MSNQLIQDILRQIQRPSSYLGTEINRVVKDVKTIKLHMALVYPDLYEIGTSHFGMQILYHLLNKHPEIWAERIFAPDLDLQSKLRATNQPLFSLESRSPLTDFDILGFSLLYELNYTNILTILDLAEIPFLAAERDASFPMIIAGGPCTCNPEPVADFFDAIVIGDGETVLEQMTEIWIAWQAFPQKSKASLLEKWSQIEGVYIPSFFKATYDPSGYQHLEHIGPGPAIIRRAIVHDLENAFFPVAPTIPFGRPVHDRLRLEIARGCTRGCRFCQAGMIYRPVRERSPETLLSQAEKSLANTGYTDISLLSLSTGDYSCISPLLAELMKNYAADYVAISLPSLRAGTLTAEVMQLIKKVRKTGFTIAPEAGSQRLRDVINKNVSEESILQTVENAFDLGWQVIKLYFMIGLPTENESDLEAIVDLVKKLNQRIKTKKAKKKSINVSFTTFIPKPHVPFQWASQISLNESQEKLRILKQRLKMRGVFVKWQDPKVSVIEGLFARGDRRLSRLLINAYNIGCRFDGWSDRFNFAKWQEALYESNIDIDFFTTRSRTLNEPLPWDHIDIKVSKSFLKKEWENALDENLIQDCRNEKEKCNQCGVCDFKKIKPVISEKNILKQSFQTASEKNDFPFKKMKITFSKQDTAIWFGHLELVNIFLKALNRIGLKLQYSKGFHPNPKIKFEDALPIGISSLNEIFYVNVKPDNDPAQIIQNLNRNLPEGLNVHQCVWIDDNAAKLKTNITIYEILLNAGLDQNQLDQFWKSDEVILIKINRKGNTRKIDLKEAVTKLELLTPSKIKIELLNKKDSFLRPQDAVKRIFSLSDEILEQAAIRKL